MSGSAVFLSLVALAVLAFAGWLAWTLWRTRRGGPDSLVAEMKREYARRIGLPPAQAYDALERAIERKMKEDPGQPVEVYLDAILKELRRDRR